MIFFCRRIIFAVNALYLRNFIWAQLAIQMTTFLLTAGYQLHSKFLESPFVNRTELMNESTILILTYGELHFTEYLSEPENRNVVGIFYIVVVMLNVSVHLIFLIRDTCIKGKFACRRCYYSCRYMCSRFYIWSKF